MSGSLTLSDGAGIVRAEIPDPEDREGGLIDSAQDWRNMAAVHASRKALHTLALAAVTVTAAACGGSGGATTRSTDTTAANAAATKTETASNQTTSNGTATAHSHNARFAGEVEAICIRRTPELTSATGSVKNSFAISQLANRRAVIEQAGLSEMEKLKPPAGLAADWKVFTAQAQVAGEDLAQLGGSAALHGNNPQLARYGLAYELARHRMRAAAKRMRLVGCAGYG
jgi:hypothetical protein